MSLPDGSMVLICPVGPEYSQVGDDQFDFWSSDIYSHVEEISASLFSLWYSNVKRVTTLYTTVSSEGDETYRYASNGVQWRLNELGVPTEKNTGSHPFPKMRISEGYFETPYTPEANFLYFNEEYPTDAYGSGLPFLFIHADKFYFVTNLEYPDDGDSTHTAVLTEDTFTLTFTDVGGPVITYRITIDETFY